MKTITSELKSKIFSQYFGQKVLFNGSELVLVDKVWNWLHPSFYLQLTPLSKITDEDSIEIYRMLGYNDEKYGSGHPKMMFEFYGKIKLDKPNKWGFNTSVKIYQYLQSKGYAISYLDYSVDDLVGLGVYKFI